MSDFLPVLDTEIRKLEAQLQKLRDLRTVYANGHASVGGGTPAIRIGAKKKPIGSKAARVEAAIIELMRTNGAQHRSAVLDELKAKGLMGNESDPMQQLAQYLSKSDKFRSLGDGNWTLK